MSTKHGISQSAEPDVGDDISGKVKRAVHRSPAYPFIPLSTAVDRSDAMYKAASRHAVRVSALAQPWGYSFGSSLAAQVVSALRQFGLLEIVDGQGNDRVVRLSELALRILLDKRGAERAKALCEAAMRPALYAELWEKWGAEIPSDSVAESHLMLDRSYNPASVASVLSAYKATLQYAGMLGAASVSEPATNKIPAQNTERDDMEQVQPIEAKAVPMPALTPVHGEEEYLRVKLSGGRTARVLFRGPDPTDAEIKKLIKHLQLAIDDGADADTTNDKQ
jgi:hypothetical protein